VALLMGRGGDLADEHQAGRLGILTDRIADLQHAWERTKRHQAPVDLAVALVNHRLVDTPLTLTRRESDLWCACPSGRMADHCMPPFPIDTLEACLAALPEVAAVACAPLDIGDGRVLACWVALAENAQPERAEPALRRHLKRALADTLHPEAFIFVERLPLTAEGRLDAERLPLPQRRAAASQESMSDVEHALSAIWHEVLGVPGVGIHQDFFALGGDSILAAVIVSKAALQGLYFQPRHLFEHGTIASLSSVVSTVPQLQVEQGPVAGEQVPGPASGWFFDRVQVDRSHFNQALLVGLRQAPDAPLMAEALRLLAQQHDGLRSHFKQQDGHWRQVFGDGAAAVAPHWSIISCTDDAGRTCPERWQGAVAEAQASLDLERGPLWCVHWLAGATVADSRLLVVVHHLLVDGVSWGILLQDLSDIYTALEKGASPALPLKTSSVKEWVERWLERGRGDGMQADREHWQALASDLAAAPVAWRLDHARLPSGGPSRSQHAMGAPCRSTVALDAELTTAFRTTAHRAYGTDANDLLMAALQAGFHAWGGGDALLVDLEGHGRDALGDAVDLSRSIGWFTSIYPVRLDGVVVHGPGRLLKQTKERLRSIPGKGAGYGVLRYLEGAADASLLSALTAMPRAPVLFTYLGVLDQMAAGASLYSGVVAPASGIRSARQVNTHELDICAYVSSDRLTLEIAFDGSTLNPKAIDVLAHEVHDALVALIEHCLSDDAGGLTPSDLPGMDIDQDGLDALLAEVEALEP
jgi:non-ribosomal peptide synthase protein (TIGR01720 family)